MANNMVGCRAGAGTDRNLFALVHGPDFRDRSWGEAAPQQVCGSGFLHIPPVQLWLDRGALPCSPVAASVFPGPFRHSEGLSEAGTDCL